MADSITGAITSGSGLSQTTKDLLTSLVAGLDQSKTPASVTTVGSTTVVAGVSADGNYHGAVAESAAPVTGVIQVGTNNSTVNLPANVGIVSQGLPTVTTTDAAKTYLSGLISAALPSTSTDPAVVALNASLNKAVNQIVTANVNPDSTVNKAVAVNVITVTDSTPAGSAPHDIVVTSNNSSDISAFVMSAVKPGNALVIGNSSNTAAVNAVIVGPGTVKVSGNAPALIIGDAGGNQVFQGGTGSDTLVGGGGSDTLIGGSGTDTFGFNAGGQYVIKQLSVGDSFQFNIPGITNFNQLSALVTGTVVQNGTTTYSFVGGSTITLVGITPDQITANLIHFG